MFSVLWSHGYEGWKVVMGVPDDLFLYLLGILVIAAQHLNALTGWAMPVLVDKT